MCFRVRNPIVAWMVFLAEQKNNHSLNRHEKFKKHFILGKSMSASNYNIKRRSNYRSQVFSTFHVSWPSDGRTRANSEIIKYGTSIAGQRFVRCQKCT